MSSLAPLVSRRLNAPLAWLAVLALVGATAVFALAGTFQWAVLSTLLWAVAVVPSVVARDASVTFPGELLALVAAPVVARAAGTFPQATPFLAVAGLALLVTVLADEYSSLEMTPRFAVVFVVVTTLAFAGVWAVAGYLSDAYLGTAYVVGQRELMWDLVVAAAMGVVGGAVFEVYFTRSDRANLDEADRTDGGTADGADAAPSDWSASNLAGEPSAPGATSASIDGEDGRSRAARLTVRGMQVGLTAILLFAAWRGRWGLLVNSAVPLAVTFLPALVRREYGYSMHAGLALWLTLAVFLHAVGALGPYRAVDWYDTLTHALSGSLVAGVGYVVARSVDLYSDDVDFSPRFRSAFIVLFVLAVGVLWEIVEFATGLLAAATGGQAALAQYGVDDIAKDLVFNVAGALVVAAWGTGYFERPARAVFGRVGGLVRRE